MNFAKYILYLLKGKEPGDKKYGIFLSVIFIVPALISILKHGVLWGSIFFVVFFCVWLLIFEVIKAIFGGFWWPDND